MTCGSCSTTTSELPAVLQSTHHIDHAPHVARMQADRRLIQHKQRVDQRRAERRRQIDALHFAAGQRARLAIEREVTQAHIQQISRTGRGSRAAPDRSLHPAAPAAPGGRRIVCSDRWAAASARECRRPAIPPAAASLHCTPFGLNRKLSGSTAFASAFVPRRHSSVGLQSRAIARGAWRVRAVLRQQHANMHLVGLAFRASRRSGARHTTACLPSYPRLRAPTDAALRSGRATARPAGMFLLRAYLMRSSWHSRYDSVCHGRTAPPFNVLL